MRSKNILAASLVLSLSLAGLACNRADQSPTATAPTPEKQAMASSTPEKMLESAPPAAGMPSTPSSTPATSDAEKPAQPEKNRAMPPSEPRQKSD